MCLNLPVDPESDWEKRPSLFDQCRGDSGSQKIGMYLEVNRQDRSVSSHLLPKSNYKQTYQQSLKAVLFEIVHTEDR